MRRRSMGTVISRTGVPARSLAGERGYQLTCGNRAGHGPPGKIAASGNVAGAVITKAHLDRCQIAVAERRPRREVTGGRPHGVVVPSRVKDFRARRDGDDDEQHPDDQATVQPGRRAQPLRPRTADDAVSRDLFVRRARHSPPPTTCDDVRQMLAPEATAWKQWKTTSNMSKW